MREMKGEKMREEEGDEDYVWKQCRFYIWRVVGVSGPVKLHFCPHFPLPGFTLGGICQIFAGITCICLANGNINGQNVWWIKSRIK